MFRLRYVVRVHSTEGYSFDLCSARYWKYSKAAERADRANNMFKGGTLTAVVERV